MKAGFVGRAISTLMLGVGSGSLDQQSSGSAVSAARNDDMQVPARSLAIRGPDRPRRGGGRDAGIPQGSNVR